MSEFLPPSGGKKPILSDIAILSMNLSTKSEFECEFEYVVQIERDWICAYIAKAIFANV